MDILNDDRDEVVNTTHRYNHYCRAISKDGRSARYILLTRVGISRSTVPKKIA
jgi:hypothetical protein